MDWTRDANGNKLTPSTPRELLAPNTVPSKRKPHNDWAGYVCEIRNRYTGGHTVIVDVKNGGDWSGSVEDGGRYIVICNDHGTLVQDTNLSRARLSMKDPTNVCDGCRCIEDPKRCEGEGCPETERQSRIAQGKGGAA